MHKNHNDPWKRFSRAESLLQGKYKYTNAGSKKVTRVSRREGLEEEGAIEKRTLS